MRLGKFAVIKRIVDISEPAYVHMLHHQLLIDKQGKTVAQIPVEDLGVLILQHPAIVTSQALLVACQQNNVAVVVCDASHLPYALLLPLTDGNTLHNKTLHEQIALTESRRKRMWQLVVKQKITEQANVVQQLGKSATNLYRLADQVKPGDPDNLEAQAAQKYWHLLFGDDFRRNTEATGCNSVLNYGYAIVRALVARAIVGSGLHPALGIQHSNQYNGLCLADDLMEPLRPWVDLIVYDLAQKLGSNLAIDKQTKVPLLNLLSESVLWQQQKMPLMVACHYWLADFKRSFTDRRLVFQFPQRLTVS